MNIRDAILKAADHIERSPSEFRFMSLRIPSAPSCGTPGCALGWIGAFASLSGGIDHVAGHNHVGSDKTSLLGIDQDDFYARMRELQPGWSFNSKNCSRALRLYADRYHPASEPSLDPQFVRFRDSLYREFAMTRSAQQTGALS